MCVRARARVCVRACVPVCVCVCVRARARAWGSCADVEVRLFTGHRIYYHICLYIIIIGLLYMVLFWLQSDEISGFQVSDLYLLVIFGTRRLYKPGQKMTL